MSDERDEEQRASGRPRVVDKRVSSGSAPPRRAPEAGPEPEARPEQEGRPEQEVRPEPEAQTRADPRTGAPGGSTQQAQPGRSEQPSGPPVWTPEQEAEARRVAEEIAKTPTLEWVVNAAVTLVNVAATKMDLGDPREAQLAIDAIDGMLAKVGDKLGEVEGPLRQTLTQLKMAYAEKLGPPK